MAGLLILKIKKKAVAFMNITTFKAFKSRNYRLYITGQSISLIGTWMQKTAVSWVVYSLTHSKFMLGLSLFASLFPSFLFATLGGVVADRVQSLPVTFYYSNRFNAAGCFINCFNLVKSL